ncbi:MAG TPA: VOC family protein [Patescibacteria group bacterium]|nr:VOC family protein [Patescibacteria group bacterium]
MANDSVEPAAAPTARRGRLHPHNVVIDVTDHDVVVPFWETALGWTVHRINDQFVALRPPADQAIGFDILFQKVPEPKTAKNRAHIDFDADDIDTEVARLVALGGAVVDAHSLGSFRWTIVADPEGNEFCVTIR